MQISSREFINEFIIFTLGKKVTQSHERRMFKIILNQLILFFFIAVLKTEFSKHICVFIYIL